MLLMGTYEHIPRSVLVSKRDPGIPILMHAQSFGSEK